MTQSLPVVAPLERALFLRSVRWFREMSTHEVVVLAQLMREEWLPRGTVLLAAGEPVRAVHLVVEGRVRCERDGQPCVQSDSPDAVGLLELLADVDSPAQVSADTNVLALVIDGAALFDVLDDHFSVFLYLRAALGRELQELRAQGAGLPPPPSSALDVATPSAPTPLGPVEQLIWLRRSPELRAFGISVLPALIREGGEIRLEPGEMLWQRDSEPDFLVLIVRGTVTCTGPDGTHRAGPGSVVGLDAVFCGVPHADDARAESEVSAIRVDTGALLDVAEDHFHVGTCLLAYGARRLLAIRAATPMTTATSKHQEAAA